MSPEVIENAVSRERTPESIVRLHLNDAHICGNVECNTISNCDDVCPNCTSQTEPFRPHRSTSLAHEIAVRAARCDIGSFSAPVTIDEVEWYDTSLDLSEDERTDIDQAIRYLDLTGVLIHHPAMPHVVRWED